MLLGSVFLPPSVLEPLAVELRRRGHRAHIAAATDVTTPERVLEAYASGFGDDRGVIAVAHSNAGLYVAGLVSRGLLGGAVFMDAVVPPVAGGQQPVIPPDRREPLLVMASGGVLPRWTEWWPAADVRALFPDEPTFAEVDAATPRVPTSYLDGTVTIPAGWASGLPAAFLAFGETYRVERERAESLGWPTRTLDLGHLGQLEDPALVAESVLELVEAMTA